MYISPHSLPSFLLSPLNINLNKTILFKCILPITMVSLQVLPSTELSHGDHTFKANGITFSYTISGTGPLLIAQSVGWGATSAYVQRGLQPLEVYFTLLYFEPRGNGGSSRPASQSLMTTALMADDLELLRLHLGQIAGQKLRLIGRSNGGSIILAYASRFPEKVEALVLVSHRYRIISVKMERYLWREESIILFTA
jgi:pimeloyl-ACP methyl ester carboxylesterase